MPLTLADLPPLFTSAGSSLYSGEAITQREHALQAAYLAEQAGEYDELIVACLLHDLGHIIFEQGDEELAQGQDDLHQFRVLPFLRHWLPDAVVDAIGLHVDAKRYLCFAEADYLAALSPASQLSLALQGGVMDAAQAAAFLAKPHANAAVALRRYDDAAKVVGMVTPDLDHYLPRIAALAKESSA